MAGPKRFGRNDIGHLPTAGTRNTPILRTLVQVSGHMDLSVFLKMSASGTIAVADTLNLDQL